MGRRWLVGIAIVLGFGVLTARGVAANRFVIKDKTLPIGGTGQVPVHCDNDVDILAFQIGIDYDETKLTVVDVSKAGTVSNSADFFDGKIDVEEGSVGWGCVFDTNGSFSTQYLPAGTDHTIAVLTVEVADLETEETTELEFRSVSTNPAIPPIENLMTDGTGHSIAANRAPQGVEMLALVSGTLTLSAGGEFFKRGDANGDAGPGVDPDLSDAVFILLWLYSGGDEPSCKDAADIDDNGDIELTDAVYLLSWLYIGAGNPPPPPPGASICGPDTTVDEPAPGGDLGCLEYRGGC